MAALGTLLGPTSRISMLSSHTELGLQAGEHTPGLKAASRPPVWMRHVSDPCRQDSGVAHVASLQHHRISQPSVVDTASSRPGVGTYPLLRQRGPGEASFLTTFFFYCPYFYLELSLLPKEVTDRALFYTLFKSVVSWLTGFLLPTAVWLLLPDRITWTSGHL